MLPDTQNNYLAMDPFILEIIEVRLSNTRTKIHNPHLGLEN